MPVDGAPFASERLPEAGDEAVFEIGIAARDGGVEQGGGQGGDEGLG